MSSAEKRSAAVEKIGEFDKFGSVLGLERVRELLSRLGNPQKDLKIIHVAGTNGKGSVSRFIYSVLREAGLSTGIYSSPFLEVFNERIELNGEYISEEELEKYADVVSAVAKNMCDEGMLSPTEFDVVTAIAFMYFKDRNADFVVLEVGLGGRGDSTNVIDKPLISVITSIGYDHTDRLGESLSEIAMEKAGIIKPGIPVVSGANSDEARKVILEKAVQENAFLIEPLLMKYDIIDESINGSSFRLPGRDTTIEISMVGEHQIKNAVIAVATLEKLQKDGYIDINISILKKGMKNAVNKGRFEVLQKNPLVIADGAHNIDGMKSFVNTVCKLFGQKKVAVVFGVLKDKDTEGMVNILSEVNGEFILTEPDNPRKLSATELEKLFRKKGLKVLGTMTPEEAVSKATGLAESGRYEGVLFVGSLYLIGEIRRRWCECKKERKSTSVL